MPSAAAAGIVLGGVQLLVAMSPAPLSTSIFPFCRSTCAKEFSTPRVRPKGCPSQRLHRRARQLARLRRLFLASFALKTGEKPHDEKDHSLQSAHHRGKATERGREPRLVLR